MAAKKMTAKKMPAKRAASNDGEKMTPAQIRSAIYKAYGLSDKSVVHRRGSSDPGKMGPVSRKEYQQEFDGVVSEGSLGTGPKVAKVAMQIAGEQWDRTFGAKKSKPKSAPKSSGKTMPASMKKAPRRGTK